jgi:hypothetical protein
MLTLDSPTTQEDTASIKSNDPHNYGRQFVPAAPWPVELGPSFPPYSFPTSMPGELGSLDPSHDFDPLWQLSLHSTNVSSPRSTGPGQAGWEMVPSSFPASLSSSPASTYASIPPAVVPQSQGSVPYPLPWLAQRDPYGDLNLEGLLEDQHLGMSLSLRTKQHYADAYWENFHPQFPILHEQSYRSRSPNPLLGAAVMAVGAQYADEPFAKNDSRVLHEKCLELITKVEDF